MSQKTNLATKKEDLAKDNKTKQKRRKPNQ